MTTMLNDEAPASRFRPAAGHDDSRILAQRALNGGSQLRAHALARHRDQIIDAGGPIRP